MRIINRKRKDKYENTFYRESQVTKERFSIFGFFKRNWLKIIKFAFFGFMIITTLWGCVNGFMIRTSPMISDGMEVFMNYDTTIPNYNIAEKDITYQLSYDGLDVDEDSEKIRYLKTFPFRAYGNKVFEDGNPSPEEEFNFISELNYDISFSNQISLTNSSVFNFLTNKDQTENKGLYIDGKKPTYDEDNENRISPEWKIKYGMSCVIYGEDDDGNEDQSKELISPGCFIVDDPKNPLSWNTPPGAPSGSNFMVVEGLDITKDDDGRYNKILDISKFLINSHALYTGGNANAGEGLINPTPEDNPDVVFVSKKKKNEEESDDDEKITLFEWTRNLIGKTNSDGDVILTQEDHEEIGDYDPDFSVIDRDNYDPSNDGIFIQTPTNNLLDPYWTQEEFDRENVNLDYGSSLYIGRPEGVYSPSVHAFDVAVERRKNNWYELETNDQGGKDPKISNAGWVVTDINGDPIELISEYGNVDYMAASQRELNKGYYKKGDNLQRYSSIDVLTETFINEQRNLKIDNPDFIFEANYEDEITGSKNGSENDAIKVEENEYYIDNDYLVEFKGFTNLDEKFSPVRAPDEQVGISTDMGESMEATNLSKDNKNRISIVSWEEAWENGPFYGMFIWPLSKIALGIQSIFPASMGIWSIFIGIFIIVFGLRIISWLMSIKSNKSQLKMQEVQTQVARINAKYEKYKGNKQMKQRKQLEVMALYRKNNINPLSSLGGMFLTMPVFLSIWTIINAISFYKLAVLGPIVFSNSVFSGLFSIGGGGLYVLFAVLIIIVQYVQAKIPTWLSQKRQGIKYMDEKTRKQVKKSGKTQKIMLIIFTIMGFTVPLLLSIYWIYSGFFTILQSYLQHVNIMRKQKKKQRA